MALTENMGTKLNAKFGTIKAFAVAPGQTIYRGASVAIAKSGTYAGYAYPAADNVLYGCIPGIAMEKKVGVGLVNSGDEVYVRVRQDGSWSRLATNALQSWIGKLAVVLDDEEVQLYDAANAANLIHGRIIEVISSAEVRIDITDKPGAVATGLY
jgi:uridine phosphorylase